MVPTPLEESRQTFHRPKSALDWENQKTKITEIYGSNELENTMKIMKEQHGFQATYAMFSQSVDPTPEG